ncbi:MAG: small subunit ribosomal protein [Candidatus Woesearchaeota archaeon]|nr:small subunit ribosomal protein [Candidatus Woesearchaeota archaeon]
MIERSFIKNNVKLQRVRDYIFSEFKQGSILEVEIKRTPLGEKIVIKSSRPGIIVGRKGRNIGSLSEKLKEMFGLENPEIEVIEVENPYLDPRILAEDIALRLERYGPNVFKSAMHKTIEKIMHAGARGAEIIISGKVPGARAKTWRVSKGHLKKSGYPAQYLVKEAKTYATLKVGKVGVTVRILPPDAVLPDDVKINEQVSGESS